MSEFGRKSDLARMLGISPSAVGQAMKKHNIQVGVDGKFNLQHAECVLRDKQNQVRSKGQRGAKKQPAGLRDPRTRREIIRLTWAIWDEAIINTIKNRAETSFVDEVDRVDLENYLYACMGLWTEFHKICERELPGDLADYSFKRPDCIDFNLNKPALDQVRMILKMAAILPPPRGKNTLYEVKNGK